VAVEKKDFICPKCGRKMQLVAAGYYCMKDDYLVDPRTGKPPVKPDYTVVLMGENKLAEVFFEGKMISIRYIDKSLCEFSVGDIVELEIGKVGSDAAHLASVLTFGIILGDALVPGAIKTLKIGYLSRTGLKTSITLGSDRAKEIFEKIESLRSPTET
jgi:hypothetical protein